MSVFYLKISKLPDLINIHLHNLKLLANRCVFLLPHSFDFVLLRLHHQVCQQSTLMEKLFILSQQALQYLNFTLYQSKIFIFTKASLPSRSLINLSFKPMWIFLKVQLSFQLHLIKICDFHSFPFSHSLLQQLLFYDYLQVCYCCKSSFKYCYFDTKHLDSTSDLSKWNYDFLFSLQIDKLQR